MLDDHEVSTLIALRQSDGATFTELMEIAGLDPAQDLRDTDLRGVDFAGCDLAGYDFSGATLSGSSFRGARIEGAIFDRADLGGVKWPAEHAPGADGRIRRSRRPQLRPRQREIADALFRAVNGKRPARAIGALPPGVGKTAIVAEIFSRLPNVKAFRRGLILTETVAERDHLMKTLQEWGVETCGGRDVERIGLIAPGLTLVETYGNYLRLLANIHAGKDGGPNPLRCTHLALASLPTRRRSVIAAIADGPSPPSTLGFVEVIAGVRADERLKRGKLGEIFGEITYFYDLAQAVADGLLTTSLLVDRTAVIRRFRDRGEVPKSRGDAVREVVAHDFVKELGDVEESGSVMMIVPDIENVELMVDELRSELRDAGLLETRGFALFALTSRIKAADRRSAVGTPGAVIVTTPMMADHLDLRQFATVGTLATLHPRLASLLRNPPPSPDGKQLPILDYAGSVAANGDAVG